MWRPVQHQPCLKLWRRCDNAVVLLRVLGPASHRPGSSDVSIAVGNETLGRKAHSMREEGGMC